MMPSSVDPASIQEVIAKAEALRLGATASTASGSVSLFPSGESLPPHNLPLYQNTNEDSEYGQESPLESPWPATHSSATRSRSTTMSGCWDGGADWDATGSECTRMTSHESIASSSTMPPPPAANVLPCEFVGLAHCDSSFALDQTKRWYDHLMHHFRGNFPPYSLCWFCDTGFRANPPDSAAACRKTYRTRLDHILAHIRAGEFSADDMRIDPALVTHLYASDLISEETAAAGLAFIEDMTLPAFRPADWEPPERVAAKARANRFTYDQAAEDRRRRRDERDRKGKERASRR